jgi:hypothetical protein
MGDNFIEKILCGSKIDARDKAGKNELRRFDG